MYAKFRDAGEMLWLNLDSREKAMLGFAAFYLTLTLLALLRDSSRERLKRELREELAADAV